MRTHINTYICHAWTVHINVYLLLWIYIHINFTDIFVYVCIRWYVLVKYLSMSIYIYVHLHIYLHTCIYYNTTLSKIICGCCWCCCSTFRCACTLLLQRGGKKRKTSHFWGIQFASTTYWWEEGGSHTHTHTHTQTNIWWIPTQKHVEILKSHGTTQNAYKHSPLQWAVSVEGTAGISPSLSPFLCLSSLQIHTSSEGWSLEGWCIEGSCAASLLSDSFISGFSVFVFLSGRTGSMPGPSINSYRGSTLITDSIWWYVWVCVCVYENAGPTVCKETGRTSQTVQRLTACVC